MLLALTSASDLRVGELTIELLKSCCVLIHGAQSCNPKLSLKRKLNLSKKIHFRIVKHCYYADIALEHIYAALWFTSEWIPLHHLSCEGV